MENRIWKQFNGLSQSFWEKTRLSNHISKFTCQPSLPTPASLSFPIKPALASLGNNLNEY